MKSLVKKLANTNIGILLRNSFNFRPILPNVLKSCKQMCYLHIFEGALDLSFATYFLLLRYLFIVFQDLNAHIYIQE